jgi:hypothetical protein
MKTEIPRCPYCKSTDILRDAFAVWEPEVEGWVLHSIYDGFVCNTCSSDLSHLEWVEYAQTLN